MSPPQQPKFSESVESHHEGGQNHYEGLFFLCSFFAFLPTIAFSRNSDSATLFKMSKNSLRLNASSEDPGKLHGTK